MSSLLHDYSQTKEAAERMKEVGLPHGRSVASVTGLQVSRDGSVYFCPTVWTKIETIEVDPIEEGQPEYPAPLHSNFEFGPRLNQMLTNAPAGYYDLNRVEVTINGRYHLEMPEGELEPHTA